MNTALIESLLTGTRGDFTIGDAIEILAPHFGVIHPLISLPAIARAVVDGVLEPKPGGFAEHVGEWNTDVDAATAKLIELQGSKQIYCSDCQDEISAAFTYQQLEKLVVAGKLIRVKRGVYCCNSSTSKPAQAAAE